MRVDDSRFQKQRTLPYGDKYQGRVISHIEEERKGQYIEIKAEVDEKENSYEVIRKLNRNMTTLECTKVCQDLEPRMTARIFAHIISSKRNPFPDLESYIGLLKSDGRYANLSNANKCQPFEEASRVLAISIDEGNYDLIAVERQMQMMSVFPTTTIYNIWLQHLIKNGEPSETIMRMVERIERDKGTLSSDNCRALIGHFKHGVEFDRFFQILVTSYSKEESTALAILKQLDVPGANILIIVNQMLSFGSHYVESPIVQEKLMRMVNQRKNKLELAVDLKTILMNKSIILSSVFTVLYLKVVMKKSKELEGSFDPTKFAKRQFEIHGNSAVSDKFQNFLIKDCKVNPQNWDVVKSAKVNDLRTFVELMTTASQIGDERTIKTGKIGGRRKHILLDLLSDSKSKISAPISLAIWKGASKTLRRNPLSYKWLLKPVKTPKDIKSHLSKTIIELYRADIPYDKAELSRLFNLIIQKRVKDKILQDLILAELMDLFALKEEEKTWYSDCPL